MDTEQILKRLESLLDKHDTVSAMDAWPGPVRREMNNIGVVQGDNGLPKIHYDKKGKTVSGIHRESYELRFDDLSTRHTGLKSDYASLKRECANLKLEIERLKHGNSVDGEVYEGEVIESPVLKIINE